MNALLLVSATVIAYFAAAMLVEWMVSEMKLPVTLQVVGKRA